MLAVALHGVGIPLVSDDRPMPIPGPFEILIRVEACGVCRIDLHVIDGDLACQRLPLVLRHEIVGTMTRAVPASIVSN